MVARCGRLFKTACHTWVEGAQIRLLPACLLGWLAVYHGCRINETTHVKDATGDQEQMPCDLHATVAAGATAASESVVWSEGWREGLSCKLGVDSGTGALSSSRPGRRAHYCQLKTCQQFATTINRATKVTVTIEAAEGVGVGRHLCMPSAFSVLFTTLRQLAKLHLTNLCGFYYA